MDNITVVIPTHRREPIGLEHFLLQTKHVWILNNGSVPISEKYTNKVINITVVWKGHGQTRQDIVSQIETEFLFFTVDDAQPMPNMLSSLLQTLKAKNCDAVVARQLPYPDASPITIRALDQWTPKKKSPYSMPQTDHVGTLYQTEMLRKYPLPNVPIAEDAWWSIGKNVLCDPSAVIVHSHVRRTKDLFLRELKIHRELKKMGHKMSPTSIASDARGILGNAFKYGYKEGLRTSAEILARRFAWR